MPKLANNQSTEFLKVLLMGDPGSGKTGGLTSLVKAGYKLRIYDFDNLLGSLMQYVAKDCPDKIGNVDYQTFTDKMGLTPGMNPIQMIGGRAAVSAMTDGIPQGFSNGMKQLTHWKEPDGTDLGKPSEWGADTIVVIDSLTSLANSAFRYAQAMNPMAKEPQTYYFSAQELVKNILALLASEQMRTNVIVIAHIYYEKNQFELTKGFPRSIGAALNTQIAAFFNAVLMVESVGSGTSVKRSIRTNSTGIVDLKNPVSFKLPDSLPLETGLADFFKAVKAA